MSADRLLRDVVAAMLPGRDAAELIGAGTVLVDGVPVTSALSRVRSSSTVTLRAAPALRGSAKLRAALAAFRVDVTGMVAIDVGASTGGFTTVLLEEGARRVYAVDAGHGQLLGSLRQDPRVVNLESVNVGDLNLTLVPDAVDVVTVDVSYLSLSSAVIQLGSIRIASGATLVGLVKPMFELRTATAPSDDEAVQSALAAASTGVEEAGWRVAGAIDSPVRGARGAREMLIHAVRA